MNGPPCHCSVRQWTWSCIAFSGANTGHNMNVQPLNSTCPRVSQFNCMLAQHPTGWLSKPRRKMATTIMHRAGTGRHSFSHWLTALSDCEQFIYWPATTLFIAVISRWWYCVALCSSPGKYRTVNHCMHFRVNKCSSFIPARVFADLINRGVFHCTTQPLATTS